MPTKTITIIIIQNGIAYIYFLKQANFYESLLPKRCHFFYCHRSQSISLQSQSVCTEKIKGEFFFMQKLVTIFFNQVGNYQWMLSGYIFTYFLRNSCSIFSQQNMKEWNLIHSSTLVKQLLGKLTVFLYWWLSLKYTATLWQFFLYHNFFKKLKNKFLPGHWP